MERNSPPGSFLAWMKQSERNLVKYRIVRGDTFHCRSTQNFKLRCRQCRLSREPVLHLVCHELSRIVLDKVASVGIGDQSQVLFQPSPSIVEAAG